MVELKGFILTTSMIPLILSIGIVPAMSFVDAQLNENSVFKRSSFSKKIL